jgi:glutamyl-tRNA synthetase
MSVRVRYAPSPTGYQHIGGVRTALFNYLFARARGGEFVLRIEDTDRERYSPEALDDIYATFDWLGIHWDEGPDVDGPCAPYFQSQRVELYRDYARRLVESGHAYPCYCTSDRLAQLKQEQQAAKQQYGYDRRCRDLPAAERAAREAGGEQAVIRFKVPLTGSTGFHDELLGYVERANVDINPDPVLLKSDGFPTYHLANVIDDHLMRITHIMRAQEWLSSGPLHVLLYKALGWEPPSYIHLPMVMGPDGHKLSKRHGSTRVVEFRDKGYLPEALINYIALLGWSYDDSREFFTCRELRELFSEDRLNKAPAVFDYKKLDWFNGMYIRKLDPRRLAELLMPFLKQSGLVGESPGEKEKSLLESAIPLIQERLILLSEAPGWLGFLFRDELDYEAEELIPKRLDGQRTREALDELQQLLQAHGGEPAAELEKRLRALAAKLEIKLGDLLMPLRVAVTGSRTSPPLLESMALLGQETTLARLGRAVTTLAETADRE